MDPSKQAFLNSVLRYSTSVTDGTTETTNFTEMAPERRKWLENALGNMTINPVDEIKKCIEVLENKGKDNDLCRQQEAIGTLIEWCEDMNFAIDFHKIKGYQLLPQLLSHENGEMRAQGLTLVGTCAQNNPYCQKTLLAEDGLLEMMLKRLSEDDVEDVKIKALYAVSCLTRDYEPGQEKLLEIPGSIDILIAAIRSPIEKLQIKCCFLCSSICNNKQIKTELSNRGLMQTLIEMYLRNDSTIHERLLSAIYILIDDNPIAIRQAQEMKNINFKQVLQLRIHSLGDDPRYEEEKEMANKIYQNLFQN